jgi:hypothetical protein
MIEQFIHDSKSGKRTLLDEYAAAEAQMHCLRHGEAIRAAIDVILARLPTGHVTLLGTSPEGIGLAAATAAQRREPTSWQPLSILSQELEPIKGRLVVVEPIDPGPGWQMTISRIAPGATFAFAQADDQRLAA